MRRGEDFAGRRFGLWLVRETLWGTRPRIVLAVCDCGSGEHRVRACHLTTGASTGCGCSRVNFEADFWDMVIPEPNTGCWLWMGQQLRHGYGLLGYGRGRTQAHRLAWVLAHGPIPTGDGYHGTCVLHRCDNPPCVNPDHLFLGSNRDNDKDRVRKGRQARGAVVEPKNRARGERSGMAKLTETEVLAMRSATVRDYRALGVRFGINPRTVRDVLTGRTWRHVQ